MAVLPIVQLGDPVLRLPGMEVIRFDRALGQLIDDMIDTMRAAPGVGLSANQVGRREQVAVIEIEGQVWELVNPRLVQATGDATDLEGCLSVAGYYGRVARRARVVATARDRRGRRIRIAGEDLLARVLQHEVDHLDGRLYLDRMESLDELIPPRAGPAATTVGRTPAR